jgi:hypothetical protein
MRAADPVALGPGGRPARARPSPKRTAAVVSAAAGLVLLTAACGGGSSGSHVAQLGSTATQTTPSGGSAGTGSTRNQALAYADCLRTHGVPNWPDPDSSGKTPKVALEHLGVTGSQLQSAQTACRHLLPGGGRPPNQAQRQQIKAQGLRFARCVRSHGVPGFPDPDSTGRIPDPASVGIDQGSPKFQAANQACARYRPPYIPSNSAYEAYARTHPNGS